MGTKKRAAVAASVSGLAGTAVGLAASHFGLDPMESTRLGCSVSSAVGSLLFHAFRLTSDNGWGAGSASEETDRTANETSETSEETGNGSDDSINVVNSSVDTGNGSAEPTPDAEPPPSPKHPKHRKRHRAAHRRIERRQGHETEQDNSAS